MSTADFWNSAIIDVSTIIIQLPYCKQSQIVTAQGENTELDHLTKEVCIFFGEPESTWSW